MVDNNLAKSSQQKPSVIHSTNQSTTKNVRVVRTVAVIDLGDFTEDRPIDSISGREQRRVSFQSSNDSSSVHRLDASHAKREICTVQRFASRQIAGQPLILRMAARLSECQWIDQIFAVGCQLPSAVRRIESATLKVIDLPSCHLAERLGAIQGRTNAEWLVHVPANRPFVDAGLIDGLLSKASRTDGCDFVAYSSRNGDRNDPKNQARLEHLGLDGEVCHQNMIRRLCQNADRLSVADTVSCCLENAPGEYDKRYVPLPEALDHCELKFAVETESDWDDAQLLCESVAAVDADWHQVARLVQANTQLRSSMAVST